MCLCLSIASCDTVVSSCVRAREGDLMCSLTFVWFDRARPVGDARSCGSHARQVTPRHLDLLCFVNRGKFLLCSVKYSCPLVSLRVVHPARDCDVSLTVVCVHIDIRDEQRPSLFGLQHVRRTQPHLARRDSHLGDTAWHAAPQPNHGAVFWPRHLENIQPHLPIRTTIRTENKMHESAIIMRTFFHHMARRRVPDSF